MLDAYLLTLGKCTAREVCDKKSSRAGSPHTYDFAGDGLLRRFVEACDQALPRLHWAVTWDAPCAWRVSLTVVDRLRVAGAA